MLIGLVVIAHVIFGLLFGYTAAVIAMVHSNIFY